MMLVYFPILLLATAVYSQGFPPLVQRGPSAFLRHPNRRFERPPSAGYNSLPPSRDESNRWNVHPNSEPFIEGATPFLGSPGQTLGNIPLNPRPQYSNFQFSPSEEVQPFIENVTDNEETFVPPTDTLVPNAEENINEREIYRPEEADKTANLNAEYNSPTENLNNQDESVSVKSEDGVENESKGEIIVQNKTPFDEGKLPESENFDYVDDEAALKQSEKHKYDDDEYEYEDYSAINDDSTITSQKREIAEPQPSEKISFNPSDYLDSENHEQQRDAESNAFIESPSVNQNTYYENAEYNPNEQYSTLPKTNQRQPPSQGSPERYPQTAQSFTHSNQNTQMLHERAEERHNRAPFKQNANVLQEYETIYQPRVGADGHSKTANIATKKRRPYKPFWESPSPNSEGQNYVNGERYPSEAHEDEEPVEKPDRLSLLLQKTKFRCQSMKDGYYADEELDCEVFHFCQDKVRHSWLCPNGASFHQVHLICMPQSEDNICEKSSKFHFVNDYLYKETEGSRGKNKSYVQRYYPAGYEGGIASLEERQASAGSQTIPQEQEEQSFDRDYPQGPRTRVQQPPRQVQPGPIIRQFEQNFDPEYVEEETYQPTRNDEYRQGNEQRLQRRPNLQYRAPNPLQEEYSRNPRPGAAFLLNEDETVSIRRAPYIHRRLRER